MVIIFYLNLCGIIHAKLAFCIRHWRSKLLQRFILNTAWYIFKYLFLKLLKRYYSKFHSWRGVNAVSAEDQQLSRAAPGGHYRFLCFQAVQWVLTLRCKAGPGLCVQHATDILWCWCNLTATRLTLLNFFSEIYIAWLYSYLLPPCIFAQ